MPPARVLGSFAASPGFIKRHPDRLETASNALLEGFAMQLANEAVHPAPDVPTNGVAVLPEPAASAAAAPAPAKRATTRLMSLDAYRGFIMLAMASSGFAFARVATRRPDDPVLQILGHQFEHVTWEGCSFWDLIQPSFMFMVGVSLPYSHAARRAKGQSNLTIALHTAWRALVLVFLGIFLISNWSPLTDWTFTNVLTQIGLGYCFVSLLNGRGSKVQLAAVAAILVGYWAFFLTQPPMYPEFDYVSVNFPRERFEPFTGLFAHFNPVFNAPATFDSWLLNLFPRTKAAFLFNRGGYTTLNFVPSMATMILGLWAGEQLRNGNLLLREKLARLLGMGVACFVLGLIAGETVCPIVKRIWTPSWVLYSAGWTFLILVAFYLVIDVAGWKKWSLPLVVVGMNSIAVYCLYQLLGPWVRETMRIHFGRTIFDGTYLADTPWEVTLWDPVFAPIAQTVVFLGLLWLVAAWMYRRGIFVKI
jgi:predicted acyltransferase